MWKWAKTAGLSILSKMGWGGVGAATVVGGTAAVGGPDGIVRDGLENASATIKNVDALTDMDGLFTRVSRFFENIFKFFENFGSIIRGEADVVTLFSNTDSQNNNNATPSQSAFVNNNSSTIIPEQNFDTQRAISVTMDGVYEGGISTVSSVVGAPVDLVNYGLGFIGLNSDNPFGGSKNIESGLTSAYNWYARNFANGLLQEPANSSERALHITGEFAGAVGAGFGLVGGARALASKIGLSAIFGESVSSVAISEPISANRPAAAFTLGAGPS